MALLKDQRMKELSGIKKNIYIYINLTTEMQINRRIKRDNIISQTKSSKHTGYRK